MMMMGKAAMIRIVNDRCEQKERMMSKSEPVFKVGDRVTWERRIDTKYPRRSYDKDFGGSGKWDFGEVEKIEDDTITVAWCEASQWGWWWPTKGDPLYHPNQWSRRGYLRHAEENEERQEEARKCAERYKIALDVVKEVLHWVIDGWKYSALWVKKRLKKCYQDALEGAKEENDE